LRTLETASCRNVGIGCVHKTQNGRTLPKWELPELDCSFLFFLENWQFYTVLSLQENFQETISRIHHMGIIKMENNR
jgi:hypothetical protein